MTDAAKQWNSASARIRELEEAAYHLRLARDAWNFDQTEDNFKILGDAIDRVAALNARG